MSERYVVTGAAGFLGRRVVDELLSVPTAQVLGIGRSRSVADPWPAGDDRERYRYLSLDVLEKQRLARAVSEFEPTVIVHLASGLRDDAPERLYDLNVLGTLSVCDAAGGANARSRIVIASSGGVYGAAPRLPIGEDAPCVPVDFYSASKLAQEHAARIAARSHDLDVVIARLFNLVGAGLDERHACASFARKLVAHARGDQSGPVAVGNLSPTRDFIDVRDAASAIVLLSRSARSGDVYNVASGVERSMQSVFQCIATAAGLSSLPATSHTYHRAADVPRHVADIGKLRGLGFRPRYDLQTSVADLVGAYRDVA